MKKILISFIIPVYEAEKYLGRCVDSILKQKIDSFEIILVDDGSLDNSRRVCDEYADKSNNIKVIHQENGGQGYARNVGLDLAAGEWVCFIDDDDWIEDNWYSLCQSYMLDDVDIVMYAKREVYAKGSKECLLNMDQLVTILTHENDIRALQLSTLNYFYSYKLHLGKLPIGTPWGKIFKSELLKNNNCRFVEGSGEDRPCVIRAYYYAKKVVCINAALYNYYIHESTMRKYLPNAAEKFELSMLIMNDFINAIHGKDKEFEEQLRHFNIAWFSYFVIQDLSHIRNPKSYKERRIEFIRKVEEYPYADSFKYADLSCLPFKRKLLAWLIRKRKFGLMDILAKGNNLYDRLMKWR